MTGNDKYVQGNGMKAPLLFVTKKIKAQL